MRAFILILTVVLAMPAFAARSKGMSYDTYPNGYDMHKIYVPTALQRTTEFMKEVENGTDTWQRLCEVRTQVDNYFYVVAETPGNSAPEVSFRTILGNIQAINCEEPEQTQETYAKNLIHLKNIHNLLGSYPKAE